MQRCPYLQEMKERLLRDSRDTSSNLQITNDTSTEMTEIAGNLLVEPITVEKKAPIAVQDTVIGTVVKVNKLNPDGYSSHTSPTHKPYKYRDIPDYNHHFPKNAKTSLFIITSALYAKLVVVICIAYLISEVVTHNVPLHFYEGFFTYLYGTSILFLLYVFCYLLQENTQKNKNSKKNPKTGNVFQEGHHSGQYNVSEYERQVDEEQEESMLKSLRQSGKDVNLNDGGASTPNQEKATSGKLKKMKISESDCNHGSFFLRIGAIAFGLGTMIYNGLEFGAFFEIPFNSPCHQILRGVNPLLQMIFTFMQMYFIFMNSRLNIHKFKVIARFGLMHVVATNLCVWIRTLVRECLKEITTYQLRNNLTGVSEDYMILAPPMPSEASRWSMFGIYTKNGTETLPWDGTNNYSCGRVNIMGSIVTDSAPYLYPFIIEYSLIGAAVVYVIWAHIGRNPRYLSGSESGSEECVYVRRFTSRVDCVGASKGLFFGLLLLVGSLICLILFFVLVRNPDLSLFAIYLAEVSHCAVMFLSLLAMIIGFFRIRLLKFQSDQNNQLGDILLRVSAFGLFVYAVFSIIAGSLSAFTREPNLLVMVTGILSIVQVLLQMLFIADISRRRVHLPEHERTKPGRQVVTFLLICNLTMWIIYTFEVQKVEQNPVQLDFYGFMSWTLVQRLTLPLCIFHRFHSAVTFAEIWKNSYKSRLE